MPDQNFSVPAAMVSAAKHHQAGRLGEAEKLYRQVVKAEPGNADALHGLGIIANQSGHPETAAKLIKQAIGFNPEKAEYHVTLGHALQHLERLDDALGAYRRATGETRTWPAPTVAWPTS